MFKQIKKFIKDDLSPLSAGAALIIAIIQCILSYSQWSSNRAFVEKTRRTSLLESVENLKSVIEMNNIFERDNSECMRLRIKSPTNDLTIDQETSCRSLSEKMERNRSDFKIIIARLKEEGQEAIQQKISELSKMESLGLFVKSSTGIDYRINRDTKDVSKKLKLRDDYHNTYIENKRKLVDAIRDQI